MININEIKSVLTPLIVAQRYLGQPIKRENEKIWYKSPFRNERTASFVVSNEKGIHDFGSSEHYDIFSFIQKLYNLSFLDSLKFLVKDFGLEVNDTVSLSREKIELLKEEQKRKKLYRDNVKKWYNNTFVILCSYSREIKDKILHNPFDDNLYDLDFKINLYIEMFINARTFEDMEGLLKNERKEVDKLEFSYEKYARYY